MAEKMKAVRMYAPGDLRYEEADKPSSANGEVLLRIMACGICGSDIPRVNKFGAHVSPIIIGHEFSAVIEETGDGVQGFAKGDRVAVAPMLPCEQCEWCKKGNHSLCDNYDYFGSRRDGGMAEYLAVPAKNLLKLPEGVGLIEAATMDPCANAVHAIDRSGLKQGDSLAVYGAGTIGLYVCQIAKVMGIEQVIMVDIRDDKCAVARECGADHVINAKRENAPKLIKELTDGGAEVVIDCSGAPEAQKNCIMSARKEGQIVFLGISHTSLPLGWDYVETIMRCQLHLHGSWNSFASEPYPGKDWARALELFRKGLITAKPLVSHKLELKDVPAMFKLIDEGELFFNKILFLPHGDIA